MIAEGKEDLFIHNVNIVLENEVKAGALHVKGGVIASIFTEGDANEDSPALQGAKSINGNGGWLLPGFIDMHVHGGFGGDFMKAGKESYNRITSYHASQGTTGMLATTVTASKEDIENVLKAVTDYQKEDMPYAQLLGVHLEGPFISEKWPGAQNPAYIQDPKLHWLQEWTEQYPDLIKLLTLAPEKNGAVETISWLAERGIISAAGHTDANYDEMITAANAGLSHAVHTYNAMKGLHHREPGTLGAVLTDDRIHAEIIADGEHVHPAAIALMIKSKPLHKLILITDAIEAAGMPDGNYNLGGLDVIVKNSVARLREGNALAGSSLSMIRAFRFMLDHTELSIHEISRMASGNPAKELGIDKKTGSIALGKQADLVLTDPSMQVVRTWVQGNEVFSGKESGSN